MTDVRPALKIVFATGLSVAERDLSDGLARHTVGFLYKPYDLDRLNGYLADIKNVAPRLTVKMFGSFDCFINDKLVLFSSAKSKELFALLLTYNGKSLTMSDAISQLWPDAPVDKSKRLYRDAVWRLRQTLGTYRFPCVTFNRALLVLDKTDIVCDYWDYLQNGGDGYRGEFLKSYDWSVDYLAELDKK